MSLITLTLRDLEFNIRENFKKIQEFLNSQTPLHNFVHMDVNFSVAEEHRKLKHTLGSIPLDVIRTRITGPGEITFNYEDFTNEFLDVTLTGPCRVRFWVGSYAQAVPKVDPVG